MRHTSPITMTRYRGISIEISLAHQCAILGFAMILKRKGKTKVVIREKKVKERSGVNFSRSRSNPQETKI